ncbi:MAG: hypothetical protein WA917_06560 [Comamonas sp.]
MPIPSDRRRLPLMATLALGAVAACSRHAPGLQGPSPRAPRCSRWGIR